MSKNYKVRLKQIVKGKWSKYISTITSIVGSTITTMIISAAVGAIVSFVYVHLFKPESPSGQFTNLSPAIPAIGPAMVIHFRVSNLPSGWHPFILVSTEPNTFYPEDEGTLCQPVPYDGCLQYGGWFADKITVGIPRAEMYLVVADPLGTYALSSYLNSQSRLKSTFAWHQGLSTSWLSSGHMTILAMRVVRPQPRTGT